MGTRADARKHREEQEYAAEKHHALHGDFLELLLEDEDACPNAGSLANALVHLVVLHGLLPELDAP